MGFSLVGVLLCNIEPCSAKVSGFFELSLDLDSDPQIVICQIQIFFLFHFEKWVSFSYAKSRKGLQKMPLAKAWF